MILNDASIEKRINELFNFEKSENDKNNIIHQINPNSIDLTLDRHIMYPSNAYKVIYGEDTSICWNYKYEEGDYLILRPNEYVLACTQEYVIMPNDICGQLFTKSTLGRMFVNHMMAGVIDAGFEGKITLELKNDSQNNVRIPFGSRIVQMIYSKLYEPAKIPYYARPSRYVFAEKCEPSREEIYCG